MLAPSEGPNQTSEAPELWHCHFSITKAILQSSAESQRLILMQWYYQVASYFLLGIHRKMYNYVTGAFDPDYILVIMIYRYLCSQRHKEGCFMIAFFASEHPQQRKTNCNLTNAGAFIG